MAFFGRRNRKQEPEESPEYLAREAEMDRLTAAEPEPTVVSIEDLAKSIAPPMPEALSNGDLGAYDALYQARQQRGTSDVAECGDVVRRRYWGAGPT